MCRKKYSKIFQSYLVRFIRLIDPYFPYFLGYLGDHEQLLYHVQVKVTKSPGKAISDRVQDWKNWQQIVDAVSQ